jgi:tRNA threonylcarbamoyl adenosine modification protein (Sua5/YciO/YrdC/YwlC family)
VPRILDAVSEPQAAIQAAISAIRAGKCIVIPTDTVYGIAADPFQPKAVQALLDAKGRGRDMPPPLLVAGTSSLFALTEEITGLAEKLAEAFWPGPLTMILKASPALGMDLGDRGATIGVRVPDHPFALDLLRITGPLAVSSANLSGKPAANDVDEAVEQLGDSVELYLDCGATNGPEPSTIVDLTSAKPVLLRTGVLSAAELAQVMSGDETSE